jgi:DnaJ-class molecular chaperone
LDILSEKKVTVTQAILGATVEVDTVYGKHSLKVPPGAENEQKLTI